MTGMLHCTCTGSTPRKVQEHKVGWSLGWEQVRPRARGSFITERGSVSGEYQHSRSWHKMLIVHSETTSGVLPLI